MSKGFMTKANQFIRAGMSNETRVGAKTDEGFKRAGGEKYSKFMERLHQSLLFDWYLEVGCRSGRVISGVRGKTIAVDPFFRVDTDVIGSKPSLHVFQQTSDDFFASGFLEAMNIQLGLSFLDGMHLFEYLLRDIIGAERASHPHGVIALHDCFPFNFEMTTRDLNNLPKGPWTGDVWKIIPILREYRPDLKITALDAVPTGLVLLSGLDPNSTVLSDAYGDIVKRYFAETLESFGVARFNELIDYTTTTTFMDDGGYKLFQPVRLPEDMALAPKKVTP